MDHIVYHIKRDGLFGFRLLILEQKFHLGKEWNCKFLLRDPAMSVFTDGLKTEIDTSSGVFSDNLDMSV